MSRLRPEQVQAGEPFYRVLDGAGVEAELFGDVAGLTDTALVKRPEVDGGGVLVQGT
ncbi:hypothetical protein [Streptosporangium vulgare]|uniref:hypothetical protein n=1 Tax=Streptosporangium vulgare TaxID=46190 RepID=UPI0031E31287